VSQNSSMLRRMFTIVCTGSVFSVHAMFHTWERKFSILLGRCTICKVCTAVGHWRRSTRV